MPITVLTRRSTTRCAANAARSQEFDAPDELPAGLQQQRPIPDRRKRRAPEPVARILEEKVVVGGQFNTADAQLLFQLTGRRLLRISRYPSISTWLPVQRLKLQVQVKILCIFPG